jgi:V/A-type H+-transporting ATPase subunit E
MEKISEAVLDKVKKEVEDIIKDAEDKARERVEKANEQHQVRLDEEKRKLIEAAEAEAARTQAQASLSVRQELLNAKNEVVEEIVNKVKESLSHYSSGETLSLKLIKEAIDAVGSDNVIVYVSNKDMDSVQKLVKGDKEIAGKVEEFKEIKCTGGVVVEDTEGKIRVDNTYETRLEALLSRVLPEIGKELFGNL